MPVEKLAAERCHLYLWACAPLLPDALAVMSGWGFTYVTIAFVWVKMNPGKWEAAKAQLSTQAMFPPADRDIMEFIRDLFVFGPGYYTGSNVELVLLGRRGKPFAHAKGVKPFQVQAIPWVRPRKHSEKPEIFQTLVEEMYPKAGPRLELFARRPRDGWDVFGNEV